MNFLGKRSQILPSGADYGRQINAALLRGQRVLKKFKRWRTKIHTRLTWHECLEEGHSENNFIGSLHFLFKLMYKVI